MGGEIQIEGENDHDKQKLLMTDRKRRIDCKFNQLIFNVMKIGNLMCPARLSLASCLHLPAHNPPENNQSSFEMMNKIMVNSLNLEIKVNIRSNLREPLPYQRHFHFFIYLPNHRCWNLMLSKSLV